MPMNKKKLLNFFFGNGMTVILVIAMALCGVVLGWLMLFDAGRYERAGEDVMRTVEVFSANAYANDERIVTVELYDADTLLVLPPKSQWKGTELRYLNADCKREVEDIMKANPEAELTIFWLAGTYKVLAHYAGKNVFAHNESAVLQNYFSSKRKVRFTLKNEESTRNRVKYKKIIIK